MQALNIDVTKIDKTAIYEGKKGRYISLVIHENKDGVDQYGNEGFVTQDIGKERREAGERGPIVGNWKTIGVKAKPREITPAEHKHTVAKANAYVNEGTDDIPF